jgi:thiamine pyrophosphate-dependent acetolactate synthase large subunit-like protein
VAVGGSSPISQFGHQVFQEIDQVKALEACVKYADRVHNLKRIPQQVNFAFQKALNGKPGPVYAINKARQPIICSGSGVLWSKAWDEMRTLSKRRGGVSGERQPSARQRGSLSRGVTGNRYPPAAARAIFAPLG